MKKFRSVPFVFFLLFSSLTAQFSVADDALVFALDSGWKVGFKAADQNTKLLEFVTSGETVESWTRLCTINQYRRPANTAITARDFAETFHRGLNTKVDVANWSILDSTPHSITICWNIAASPGQAAQHELMRVIVTDTTIYRLAFTMKCETIPPELRDQWTSTLLKANIERNAKSPTPVAE